MHAILDLFAQMTPWQAAWWLVVENFLLFGLTLAFGHLLVRVFESRATGLPPDPLTWQEVALAVGCVVGNSVVTIAGWWLWRMGIIRIRRDTGLAAWFDVVVLLTVMDLAMYVSHRIAHIAWIYPLVHQTHHRFDRPRPLHLFVLNPMEVIGFGGLWLAVIAIHSFSWVGMTIYLALNLVFGMVGHLGVEPFPKFWMQSRVLGYVGTSTFHAGHHQDRHGNFGFYTLIWDRLFGTLHPRYAETFGRAASGADPNCLTHP